MGKLNIADVTAEQIESWKKKHQTVKKITVTLKNKTEEEFIIGKPTRSVLDSISSYTNDNKPHKVREVLENSCVLAGNTDAFEDPNVMNTVFGKVTEMLEKLQVEEKEL